MTDPRDSARAPRRAVIENLRPEVDCGRFPVKRVVGDRMRVQVDAFCDGHDVVRSVLLHRREGSKRWQETPMTSLGNDRWEGEFPLPRTGTFEYCAEAWVDPWMTWRRDLQKRIAAGQDVAVDLKIGAGHLEDRAELLSGADRKRLLAAAERLRSGESGIEPFSSPAALEKFLEGPVGRTMERKPDRRDRARFPRTARVVAARPRAGFSAWYEFFPRSTASQPGRHGSFADAEAMIPYIRDMGFDVVYLPPIHPIGAHRRKGPNNAESAGPGDVGSPWAIGSEEGGHMAIHPELGTLDDFRRFRRTVEEAGMEVALDIAFQCAPDHPWVKEHPQWFRARPDGSIQYAENPPKKYQDIYPFDFETEDWPALWAALHEVFLFWIRAGVRVFRVDNPHTKPFAFWEWVIDEIRRSHPDVIFLSEAFTRPRVMHRLAKLGFDQSYTYFTWRNSAAELTEYLTELTTTEVKEFFRPNFWPNTPDILHEFLQEGGRPAFALRAVLAALLSPNWGVYGPAYELAVGTPLRAGSEEYLDSEKYQLRTWQLEDPRSLRSLLKKLNEIRRAHLALQTNEEVRFHPTDNEHLLAFSRHAPPGQVSGPGDASPGPVLVVVNLDPRHVQSGWVTVDPEKLGRDPDDVLELHDLLAGDRYQWTPGKNFVRLDPDSSPAHVLRIEEKETTP
ncbi:MAG: alpha-1,4-glucan--maltose-1-phosphate maltosyltransferase [Gemmatimonadales bacterium]|nr:MAG: alpha-1,4-glucan--maltose-1-phosphate maltosyltransferase [Gemmatimonadales bacterium]